MDSLIANYNSDSDDQEEKEIKENISKKLTTINAAPKIDVEEISSWKHLTEKGAKEMTHNVPYQDMIKPFVGPANPFAPEQTIDKNTPTGHFEKHSISDFNFTEQQRTFHNYKYAINPNDDTGNQYIGNVEKAIESKGETIFSGKNKKESKKANKKKRKDMGNPENLDNYLGPWAGYEGETIGELHGAPEEEQKVYEETIESKKEKKSKKDEGPSETTIFHGKATHDYRGYTYMHVPQDLDVNLNSEPGSQECFIPKKLIHTWSGHTKAVNAIRFFPGSGHLLLSCSMDSKVKLWDVYNNRQCLRTYLGHTKGVRDICFTNDGRKFITASFDKYLKLWDTETGQCISKFTNHKTPYCVKFNPDEDKQNIFLTGCSDKKVYQYDINTGEVVQEYNQHLGAVNTITFVDENRRFLTTSDDKTLRAWEYDIPVVIKYIAEPNMHAIPSVAVHPNGKYIACQSMDNQVVVYSVKDKFRMNYKKRFTGHLVAGFSCQVNFSPDGHFLMSGDSEGKMFFWDWKTCKLYKKFKAHDAAVVGCEWHPHETSKVATCSWDGLIKYWD